MKTLTKLVKFQKAAEKRLHNQFPTSTPSELIEANTPRPIVEHYSGNGRKNKKVLPIPKDTFFRTKSEGRTDGVMPKRKPIKTKTELWQHSRLVGHFRDFAINAKTSANWHIYLNNPSRKMTVEDQLYIMLARSATYYLIHFNMNEQYIIIENLEGEK